MRRRLVLRNREAQNRRAGANLHGREVRGLHGENPGYRPGDNWSTCQRCGFDVYATDLREDGYKEGLMVCPKCYDPPHPQDYVRVRDDETSPVPGSTGSADSYSAVGAEGSTELPAPTGTLGLTDAPQWTAVPDQTNSTGVAITTLSLSTYDDEAFVDNFGQTVTIASYDLCSSLPTGLSLNTSTGDITGTPTGSSDSVTEVCVEAVYSDGTRAPVYWDWDVEYAGSSPDTIDELTSSNWHIWLDFQDPETIWSDDEATTLITVGEEVVVRAVTNKSAGAEAGYNNTLAQPYNIASADTYAPVYDDSVEALDFAKINTTSGKTLQFGSGICTASHPVDTGGMLYDDEVGGFTVVTVAQQPTQQTEVNHVLFGNGSNIDGLYIGHYHSEAAETGNWFTVTDGAGGSHDLDIPTPAPQQSGWAGEWAIYWFEIGPDGDTTMYFGATSPASSDEWNSETGNSTAEFPTTEANSVLQTFRVGAHDVSGGGDTPVGSWGGYIGEQIAFSTILDSTDREALWTHLVNKWGVTFNPGT